MYYRYKELLLKAVIFAQRNRGITAIIITLIVCLLLPLRLPNAFGYNYLTLPEITDDLIICNMKNDPPTRLERCPRVPDHLGSFVHVKLVTNTTALNMMATTLKIFPGGRWYPHSCAVSQRVVIIVPYRDRQEQLQIFLQHMHPFLQDQLLDYRIYVVEQSQNGAFNRGALLNIGFLEATKDADICCFIFHDVDLLPQSPLNIYGCSKNPRHMCPAIDVFRYVLPYPNLFGGVVSFTKKQFQLINGYSNLYFGWGGEDDDLFQRISLYNINICRWDPTISRYTMINHKKAVPNPDRFNLLRSSRKRVMTDGLNSVNYNIVKSELRPLFTWILVDIGPKYI